MEIPVRVPKQSNQMISMQKCPTKAIGSLILFKYSPWNLKHLFPRPLDFSQKMSVVIFRGRCQPPLCFLFNLFHNRRSVFIGNFSFG